MSGDGVSPWNEVKGVWELIATLRGESGCPWDRKQTPESVQTYLLEEAHEAAAAVRANDREEAAEELGDLLFMVFFIVQMYQDRGDFTLKEVAETICEKMVRRHPHVFADLTVNSTREVMDNWEKIKKEEKASSEKSKSGIPESLPALVRAYRTLARTVRDPADPRNDPAASAGVLLSDVDEMRRRVASGEPVPMETWGDLLLGVVNLARLSGYRAEDCLHDRVGALGNAE